MEARMKKGFFSPKRFSQLLLRDFTSGYRAILISMAAGAGGILLIAVLTALGNALSGNWQAPNAEFYFGLFTNVLFFGGFIISSLAFKEAHQGGSGIFYMTIPSSTFEKFLSKLLVTSLGFAVGTLVLITATAAVSEGVVRLIFGSGFGFFNPFSRVVLELVGIYLITQSVFLMGSLWFKKLAYVKTALWIVIFGVVTLIVAAAAARILLADDLRWDGIHFGGNTTGEAFLNWSEETVMKSFGPGTRGAQGLEAFKIAGKILFIGVLAPVCWLASYFRLGEIEV
jgi:hypothetical protein